jgi:hypothetical protein
MTLLAIFAFIAFTLGSFIWFIATWDAKAEQPVSVIAQDNNGGRA